MPTKKVATKKRSVKERLKDIADVITAVTIIGSALVGVGAWGVSKINETTNSKLDTISSQIKDMEANNTRTQLLALMSDYPDNESEILKVADYYFNTLKGDWYMTDLFTKWCVQRGIDAGKIIESKK